jgi:hypothetical protein
VQELLYFLNEASNRKKITLRQLQSLCGSLACCARALPAGRAFNRRTICLTSVITRSDFDVQEFKIFTTD